MNLQNLHLNFLTKKTLIIRSSGRVSHLSFGFEFRKLHLKILNFFTLGQKKSLQVRSKSTQVKDETASHLLRVKRVLRSGRVGSGQGPSLQKINVFYNFGRLLALQNLNNIKLCIFQCGNRRNIVVCALYIYHLADWPPWLEDRFGQIGV